MTTVRAYGHAKDVQTKGVEKTKAEALQSLRLNLGKPNRIWTAVDIMDQKALPPLPGHEPDMDKVEFHTYRHGGTINIQATYTFEYPEEGK